VLKKIFNLVAFEGVGIAMKGKRRSTGKKLGAKVDRIRSKLQDLRRGTEAKKTSERKEALEGEKIIVTG